MLKSFKTKGIGAGSFFKILYIGNFVCSLLFAIIGGIIALLLPESAVGLEAHSLAFLTGFVGFIVLIVLSPIYALLATIGQWIFIGFGLWLWTRFTTVKICLSVVGEASSHQEHHSSTGTEL